MENRPIEVREAIKTLSENDINWMNLSGLYQIKPENARIYNAIERVKIYLSYGK